MSKFGCRCRSLCQPPEGPAPWRSGQNKCHGALYNFLLQLRLPESRTAVESKNGGCWGGQCLLCIARLMCIHHSTNCSGGGRCPRAGESRWAATSEGESRFCYSCNCRKLGSRARLQAHSVEYSQWRCLLPRFCFVFKSDPLAIFLYQSQNSDIQCCTFNVAAFYNFCGLPRFIFRSVPYPSSGIG